LYENKHFLIAGKVIGKAVVTAMAITKENKL
jgi:hypothetical protein